MLIENKLESAKISLMYKIFFALFFILTVYAIFIDLKNNVYSTMYAALFVLLIYVCMLVLKLNYFYYSGSSNKLIFRYFSIHPFLGKKMAIEIPKTILSDFHVSTSLFGLKKELTLSVKTKKGSANYPPISISALTKKDTKRLSKNLESIVRTNKSLKNGKNLYF